MSNAQSNPEAGAETKPDLYAWLAEPEFAGWCARHGDDGEIAIMLEFPIAYTVKSGPSTGDHRIADLVLRRPKLKHMRAVDRISGDLSKAVEIIKQLATNLPAGTAEKLDELDMFDAGRIVSVLERFIQRKASPPTGNAPSP